MHLLFCRVPIRLFSNRKLSFVFSSPIHVMNFCALSCLYSPRFRFSCSNTLLSSLLPHFHFLLFLLLSSTEESGQSAVYSHSDSVNGHVCKTVEFLFRSLSIPSLFFPCLCLSSHFPLEFNFKWCGIFLASFKFVAFALLFNSMHMHTSTTSSFSC